MKVIASFRRRSIKMRAPTLRNPGQGERSSGLERNVKRRLVEARAEIDASVADKNVQSSEVVPDLLEHAMYLGRIVDIGFAGEPICVQFAHRGQLVPTSLFDDFGPMSRCRGMAFSALIGVPSENGI